MKNSFAISFFILIFVASCSKNNQNASYPDAVFVEPTYDTTAIDSFSKGATSVDIERKIRMSSFAYQDSIKKEMLKQQEEKKLLEEQAKLEKEAQKSLEKEKPQEQKPESKPESQPENQAKPEGN